MRKLVVFLATTAAVLALLAGGCGPVKTTDRTLQPPVSVPTLPGRSLADTSWVLASYGDPAHPTTALPQVKVTLSFNADTTQISGNGGVNGYGGDVVLTDNQLTLSGILHTMMASTDQDVNEQENTYFQLLGAAQSVDFGANTLTINCVSGQVLIFIASYADVSPSNLSLTPSPSFTSPTATSGTSGVISTTAATPTTTVPPPTIITPPVIT